MDDPARITGKQATESPRTLGQEPTKIHIVVTWTLDDFVAAQRAWWKDRTRPLYLVFAHAMIGFWGFFSLMTLIRPGVWSTMSPIAAAPVLGGAIAWFGFRDALIRMWYARAFRKSGLADTTVECELSGKGIRTKTARSESWNEWPLFPKAVRARGGLLLFLNRRQFWWFSRETFAAAADYDLATNWIAHGVREFKWQWLDRKT